MSFFSFSSEAPAWAAKVPDEWRRDWLKWSVGLSTQRPSEEEQEVLPYISNEDITSWTGKLHIDNPRPSESGGRKFQRDDVLFNKLRPYLAKVYHAAFDGVSSGELLCLRPSKAVFPRYLFYVLASKGFVDNVNAETFGAKMPRADWEIVGHQPLPLPTLKSQKRIARFLDDKTAQIDALIDKKRELLDRLAEKRQALITQAVTKGLNPDAPMKPSGVEWLGDIPEHWEIRRLKEVCEQIIDCKNRTPPKVDDGEYFVIRTSCLGNGHFNPNEGYWTDKESFDEWTKKGTPQPGDVLISREAPMGEACLYPDGYTLCLGQRMMLARPDRKKLNSFFLLSSIYSDVGREYVELRKKGTTVGHLRVPEVFNFPVVLPPIMEQHLIVDVLRNRVQLLDVCEEKIKNSVYQLQEYRSALITSAVTGQIAGLL